MTWDILIPKINGILHKENFFLKTFAHFSFFFFFTNKSVYYYSSVACDNVTTYASLWLILIAIGTSRLMILIAFLLFCINIMSVIGWMLH